MIDHTPTPRAERSRTDGRSRTDNRERTIHDARALMAPVRASMPTNGDGSDTEGTYGTFHDARRLHGARRATGAFGGMMTRMFAWRDGDVDASTALLKERGVDGGVGADDGRRGRAA